MAIGHRMRFAVAAAVALAAAAPVAAQNYSDGYKFLKAVDKQDQATVENLINKSHTIVDARDLSDGHTGLHTAVSKHALAWVNYLLAKGANPNLADKDGVTPLMLASQTGFTDAVLLLARAGAKVDESNDTGETPLIMAVHKRDLPMVRILLAAGADPNRADNSGRSARDYARLDGADSLTLAEIERFAKSGKVRKAGQTYGPTP